MIDVYRRTTKPQRKFSDLALYISFFPQLIAGPIIRYHDVSDQLTKREVTIEKFKSGVQRFVIGLARKVLIANYFAVICDEIFLLPVQSLDASTAWLGIIAFTFQVYYDFGGYSDMAIGLGRMFGFEFLENFNFPYLSKSIGEFWTRWHISLSNWFRDYLYIPLGGNRNGKLFTYRNLIIVFFITGFWHGASWNFVVWGLFHGFFIVIEKIFISKFLSRIPSILSNIYMLLVLMFSFAIFKCNTIADSIVFMKVMLGLNNEVSLMNANNYFDFEFYLLSIIGILGSTTIFLRIQEKYKQLSLTYNLITKSIFAYSFEVVSGLFLILLLYISTMYLMANTYNPFIYFRF
jgi:alginate O-acetyltransferase complex protein AlgI